MGRGYYSNIAQAQARAEARTVEVGAPLLHHPSVGVKTQIEEVNYVCTMNEVWTYLCLLVTANYICGGKKRQSCSPTGVLLFIRNSPMASTWQVIVLR